MTNSSNASSSLPPCEPRPAAATDRKAIRDILVATGAFDDEEVRVALELVDAGVSAPDSDYTLRVIEDGSGRVVGYVCYGRAPFTASTWDLYWIAVHPEHQGDGSARRLMAAVERDVRARGGRTLLIDTASKPSYARTRRFYESLGYREIARVPDYYRPGDDRITQWKRW